MGKNAGASSLKLGLTPSYTKIFAKTARRSLQKFYFFDCYRNPPASEK